MTAVDTGWVTDMAPGGVGAVAATHQTHVGPPLDEGDGAALSDEGTARISADTDAELLLFDLA